MTRDSKINKRLVALFLLGCVLLNYPILSLVNLEILIFGLPLLYIYIFSVWCLLISLTALATCSVPGHVQMVPETREVDNCYKPESFYLLPSPMSVFFL